MAFAPKKPVTLDDLDATLMAMLQILETLGRMSADMSRAIGDILHAVTRPGDGENKLGEVLQALLAQGAEHGTLLREIVEELRRP